MRLARTAALLATVALAVISCREKKAPPPPPTPAPAAPKAYSFTLRDLALATAVDAKLAKLSFAGSEIETALADPRERTRARDLVPALDSARAEADQAIAAVTNPLDRPAADRVASAAKEYSARLATAAATPAAPLAPELASARASLGEALSAYRESRVAWRFDAPGPEGAEREFAEARRDMEKAESGFMARTRVAPREEGHEFDANAVRMTGQMGVQRAKAAAGRLPPALQPHAARYVAAQEKVLEVVNAIQGAPEADRARLARGYHSAKADALSALADYFGAVAAR